jgi:hypothetical protein
MDLCELAPNWDPSGRTPAMAATVIQELLGPRIFEIRPSGFAHLLANESPAR